MVRSDIDWLPSKKQEPQTCRLLPGEDSTTEAMHALGAVLIRDGLITKDELQQARQIHRQSPGRTLAAILVDQGLDEIEIMSRLASLVGLSLERLDADTIETDLIEQLGSQYCRSNHVLPIRREKRRIIVGTTVPCDMVRLDEVKRRLSAQSIRQVLVTGSDVEAVLDSLASELHEDVDVEAILADVEIEDIEIVRQV